ncbi:MAG: tetratricopeptide repeat protein [Ktedonobacteraceae bacterium]|nr:tetratricopeptide repeat protein [Ktedonobacteraceae bacterium]
MNSKVTYRQQFTRCGKQRCRKCREGSGHGPYWYAYWSEKGRTMSKYIGIRLPDEIAARQAAERETTQPVVTQVAASPLLRIYLLGQFRIERKIQGEWQITDSRPWHRRRARALLGCLLSNPGRRLSREQIMDMLWPDLDIDIAANRLNGAVHELRQILEPHIARPATSRLLRLERDILELADNTQIWVDAEAFEQLLKEANAASQLEESLPLLEEADTLYRGSYLLEELYSEWAAPRRDALQRAWVGLQLSLAQIRTEREDYSGAIETLDRLRTAEPTNETALQRLMLLLTRLDRRGEALKVYQQHRTMLKRDYESEPLPETIKLYDELRRGHVPASPALHTLVAPAEPGPNRSPDAPDPAMAPQPSFSFTRPIFQIGRQNQSPLIGRDQEMAIMRQILHSIEADASSDLEERAVADPPLQLVTTSLHPKRTHMLLLKGESGIGKTRLAEELSIEAYTRGWAVVWSRAYEQEGTIPYHLWTDLLRTLLQNTSDPQALNAKASRMLPFKTDRLSAILPELGSASPLPRSATPVMHEQERLHLWEETLELLAALSEFSPLLLVLDDLHWADDSSLELLTYLTHHLQKQSILLVGTCRDGELPPQHKLNTLITDLRREQTITTLGVQPLTPSQISVLLSHLPGEVIEHIQKQADGNPFFAEELARYESGISFYDHPPQQRGPASTRNGAGAAKHQQASRRSQAQLPEAIAAVLERRMSRLSTNCQNLLGRAAVLGGSFELSHLLPMASEFSEDGILDLLEEALQAGLITEAGNGAHITYHFWHPLIISHLYSRTSAARRAQLHRRAAEAIKTAYPSLQQKKAAAIVYHLCHGGGSLHDIAHYAERAGQQAYAIAAYSEAQRHYLQEVQALLGDETSKQALYIVEEPDIHTQVRNITSDVLIRAPAEHLLHLCHLLEIIAECSSVQGRFEEARYLYECILELRGSAPFQQRLARQSSKHEDSKQREAQVQALLWREIGIAWARTGNYTQAYGCHERARQIMSGAGVHSGPAWACVQIQYGDMLRIDGNYQEARHQLQEALAILDPQLSSAPRLTTSHKIQTRTERALAGDPLEIGYGHERLGIASASAGLTADSLKHMHTALAIFEQNELISEMARIQGNLSAVYILIGEYEAARTHLHRALKLAERIGNMPNISFIMQNLGDVAYRSGNLLEAENWLLQGIQVSGRMNYPERLSRSYVDLAAAQQNLGKLDEARKSLLYAIRTARTISNARVLCYALIQLGDLRLVEAAIACRSISIEDMPRVPQTKQSRHLIARAQSTLRRALTLGGIELENLIEGKQLLATSYYFQGDLDTAEKLALQTLQEAISQRAVRTCGRIHRLLGYIEATRGNHTKAFVHYEQALQIFRERGLRIDYARTLHSYGAGIQQQHVAATHGPNVLSAEASQASDRFYQQGLTYLREAHAIFADCHATLDRARIEQAIAQKGTFTAQTH